MDYDRLAEHLAKDAGENHFSERRGVWWLEDVGAVCVFNNNPYRDDPFRRDEELLKLRERSEARGYRELGFGTHPPRPGPQPDYSYALIIAAPRESLDWFDALIDEVILGGF